MNFASSRAFPCGLVAFFALAVAGCGGADGLGQVSGIVTLDGELLPNATVEFSSLGQGSVSYGKTDENGHYKMEFTLSSTGASLGENAVKIYTFDVGPPPPGSDQMFSTYQELVPDKYNKNSDLVRTVESGNNEINFELDSDGTITQGAP